MAKAKRGRGRPKKGTEPGDRVIGVYPRPQRGDGVYQIVYVEGGQQFTHEVAGYTEEQANLEAAQIQKRLIGDLEAPPPRTVTKSKRPMPNVQEGEPENFGDLLWNYAQRIRREGGDPALLREARVAAQLAGAAGKHLDYGELERRMADMEKRDAARDAAREVGQDAESVAQTANRAPRTPAN